ncbi:MAG: hypothetical protein ACYDCK_12210 [Thermoplasmatota archaeon]
MVLLDPTTWPFFNPAVFIIPGAILGLANAVGAALYSGKNPTDHGAFTILAWIELSGAIYVLYAVVYTVMLPDVVDYRLLWENLRLPVIAFAVLTIGRVILEGVRRGRELRKRE